jgi:hypothetical protein
VTTLQNNVTTLQGNVTTLFANAATQQILINTINANVAAANALIPNLQAVSSNILPAANVTYSLGSETHQWRDLWVSNNTIYIGNTPIRVSGDTLLVNDVSITSNLDIEGTAITIAAGAAETYITISPNIEGQAYLQIPNDATANTYDLRIHNDVGNIEFGTNSGSSLWYFKNNGVLAFPGGVVAGEIEGSGTFGFASSSNLTQYILETSATSWTFDGSNGSLIFEVNQTISTPDAESIKVSAGLGDNTGLVLDNFGEAELYANTNVYIYTDSATSQQTWEFDNTGDLNLPNNGDINFNGGSIGQIINEDLTIRVQDEEDDGWSVYQVVDDGAGTILGSTQLQRDAFRVQFASGSQPQFRFADNGELQLPGNVRWDYPYINHNLYAVSDNNGDGSIELKTQSYSNDTLGSNIRASWTHASISTNNAQYNWVFDNTGALTAPGNIISGGGQIQFVASSSGDGYGFGTIRLVPYTAGYDTAHIIVDPTYPNHIHIRAGGEQDNSPAQLFLGGENSYFSVDSGLNPNVIVSANDHIWTFDNTGNVSINSGTTILVTESPAGLGGNSISIVAGASDSVTWNNNPGGSVNITGGYGSFGDGGGGNGGDVNITGGASSDANPGIVNINSGANTWAFDYQGGLTLPNGHIVGTNNNSLLLWSDAQDTITLRTEDDGANFYNFIFDTGGNLSVPGRVSAEYVVVTGGLISTGASPAPVISGFGSISTTGSTGNIRASGNLVASQGAYITGNLMVYGNASISNITYTSATSSDWSAPAPTTLGQAIDRLAALVKTLNGGTGA